MELKQGKQNIMQEYKDNKEPNMQKKLTAS